MNMIIPPMVMRMPTCVRYDIIRLTFEIHNGLFLTAVSFNFQYTIALYPSNGLLETYTTNNPWIYAIVVALIFTCTSLVFILYDYMVQRRQKKVMRSALNANAVVSSLFPVDVQERLLQDAEDQMKEKKRAKKWRGAKSQLKNFLEDQHDTEGELRLEPFATKPIADLFPSTTVMMADLAGFTAWSSVREPVQVFILLETVYHCFDKIAKRRRVFKYVIKCLRSTACDENDTEPFLLL
jgi:hypothetical protein